MLWTALLACTSRVFVDVADVCLLADTDGAVTATAMAYGSSAPTVACAVEEVDGVLVVSTATWYAPDPTPFRSELMLYTATTTCRAGPLAPGDWTARYAGREIELEVPGDEVCFQPENVIAL